MEIGQFRTASASGGAKEVVPLHENTTTVVIGIALLMVAFATLVLKIIEVARSK